jgi:uncharacterized oxidoreductase
MKLQNQTILITGGSSGIGLALAKQLCPKNKVIVCGRSKEKLENVKKLLPEVDAFQCDISSAAEREKLFVFLKANHSSLSVLINNAAIVHKTNFLLDDQMISKTEAEIATNLVAPIALSKMFLSSAPVSSAIINITSGLVYAPRALYPIYNATKAALHSFTQVLRYQLKDTDMKIIEIMMPVVDTPWHNGAAPKIAISPETAVSEMIMQIERGNKEIKVGKVKILGMVARFFPSVAFKLINRIQ